MNNNENQTQSESSDSLNKNATDWHYDANLKKITFRIPLFGNVELHTLNKAVNEAGLSDWQVRLHRRYDYWFIEIDFPEKEQRPSNNYFGDPVGEFYKRVDNKFGMGGAR